MGLFDKLFKREKYPASRIKKGSRMGRVYAGPEEMRKRYEHKEEEPVMEDLYAGPDMFDEPDVIENEDDAVEVTIEETAEETVEAAVEEAAEETESSENEAAPGTDPDYEEQRRKMEESIMLAVYAGPEQMSQPQVMFVYAGPMQMSKGPNMMMAYAGPNIKPVSMLEQMQAMTGPQPDPKPREVVPGKCPCCGSDVDLSGKYCPECGYPLQIKKPDDGTELC